MCIVSTKAPNIKHLRALSAVARVSSITKAADEVCLSQPAVTHAITKLEADLGIEIFKRQKTGMFLTQVGEVFVERINRMLGYLKEGRNRALDLCGANDRSNLEKVDQIISGSQIRALIAITEMNNYSLAAQALRLSKAALHKAVRDLELSLGTDMFQRSVQGVEPTPIGGVLASNFRLGLMELEKAYEAVEEWKGHKCGTVVIGCPALQQTAMVSKAINHFKDLYPRVQVMVINSPYDHQIQSLRSGKIDMILGAQWSEMAVPGVAQEVLCEDRLVVVARKGHPILQRRQNSVQDMLLYPWVLPPSGVSPRLYLDQALLHGQGLMFDDVIECPSLDLMMQLLLTSDRLGLASQEQLQQGDLANQLAGVPTQENLATKSIMLMTRSDLRPTATQSQFMDVLREAAQAAH